MSLTYAELVCLDDFDPYGAETTSDLQNYTQDIYHRISQAHGSNPDAPDAGAGGETILSTSRTPAEIQNLFVTEALNDPRTITATCAVTQLEDGSMTARLSATTDSFHLEATLSVSKQGVTLG